MNTIEKNTTKVVLNTPIDLDLAQFGAINNTKNIHKLIWLIHQINKYTLSDGKLKMHKQTYYKFLGLAPKDLNKYLNILKGAGLIEQTKVGNNISETLSEFVFLNTFEPLLGNKHTYDITNTKCPLFIRKWVADGFAVRGISTYKKPISVKKCKKLMVDNSQEVMTELESLRKKVAELEKENIILRLNQNQPQDISLAKPLSREIKPLVEIKQNEQVGSKSFEIIAKDKSKFNLLDAEKYSQKIIVELEKKSFQNMKVIMVCDENKNRIWFSNTGSNLQFLRQCSV